MSGRNHSFSTAMLIGMALLAGWIWFCHPSIAARISGDAFTSPSGVLLIGAVLIGMILVGRVSALAGEAVAFATTILRVGMIFGMAVLAVSVWNARSARPVLEAVSKGRGYVYGAIHSAQEQISELRATDANAPSPSSKTKSDQEPTAAREVKIVGPKPIPADEERREDQSGFGSLWWSE